MDAHLAVISFIKNWVAKTYQLYNFWKNHHMFEPFSQSGFSFALLPPFAIKVFSWSVNCVHLWPRPVAIHFITKQVANYKLMLFHIKYDRIMGAGDELEITWHHKGSFWNTKYLTDMSVDNFNTRIYQMFTTKRDLQIDKIKFLTLSKF